MENIRQTVNKILNIKPDDSGRAGCTYGDTDYDSLSVVFGYNLALEDIQRMLAPFKTEDKEDKPPLLGPKFRNLQRDVLIKLVGDIINHAVNKPMGKKHYTVYFRMDNDQYFSVNFKPHKLFYGKHSEKFGRNFGFQNIEEYSDNEKLFEIVDFINKNHDNIDLLMIDNATFNKWEVISDWDCGKPVFKKP